jgi:hypothetical protein
MEGTIPPKGDLTRRNDCLFRSRSIASDQKRELTQNLPFILVDARNHASPAEIVTCLLSWKQATISAGDA